MRRALAGSALWSALLLGGCVQPVAVGKYATSANQTLLQFQSVANDIAASCMRLTTYQAASGHAPDVGRDGWFSVAALDRHCASRDSAVKRVIGVSAVLAEYFAALQALADDGRTNTDSSAASFGNALAGAKAFSPAQSSAIASLAAFAGSAMSDGIRRRALTRAIETQNGNVQVVTDWLMNMVGVEFQTALANERTAADDYYHTAFAEAKRPGSDIVGSGDPLGSVVVQDVRLGRLRELNQKLDALAAYIQALKTVKEGHQQLYASRDHLDAQALAAELGDYTKRLSKVAKQLAKAF